MLTLGFTILWLALAAHASEVVASAGCGDAREAPAELRLDGTWVLDRDSSDALDPLLEAEGVSYVLRKVIDSLIVTQVITQDDDVLSIQLLTAYKSLQQTLIVDGEARTEPRADGGSIEISHRWVGGALVTVVGGVNREGEPFQTTTRRTLHDGDTTLLQVTELVRPDGSVVVVRRVYRRAT